MNVYYDHDKSELIFRNAKIEWADAKNAPFLKVEQMLTIVAEGENTIEMTSAKEFIHALNHVIIKGEEPSVNKLVAYGITYAQYADKEPYSGIFAYLGQTGSLAISNVTVGADYFESAIVGSTGDSHSVTFEKASVGMFVSKEATKEITEMNFIECAITKPAGAEFSPELRGIALNGQLVFGETVTIRPVSEGIENTLVNGGNQKFFRDGQLFILRGDKTYTVQGQEVK